MAQVVIYGARARLEPRAEALSNAIHGAVVAALQLPPEKRFHRFVPLEPWAFVHPPDRSEDYTIIELSMFEGRSVEAKKALIREIFARVEREVGTRPQDVEITIFETPRHAWGIRGVTGDELALGYPVKV